ncbi:MAG: MBOAT family protein [Clostridia bacterium]|nr:MBOAT family protein [Clostridia bacterium]
MVFSSLIFLFAFLVVTLGLYYVLPRKWRNGVLLFVSLIFYGWGEPVYILLMLASIAAAFALGFPIAKYRESAPGKAKGFLALSVGLNLASLLFFKYAGFLWENLGLLPFLSGSLPRFPEIALPIGISFYTFQIMSYSVDLYRGSISVQRNVIDFGAYVALFPQLIAGPIVRYRDVSEQLTGRKESMEQFAAGVRRFCAGAGKKVLLGDGMAAAYRYFASAGEFQPTVLGSWMILICFSLHIYYDFSGYSDMAIGLGRMFGFEFRENFDYPYVSSSITDFWRRWHISLSSWFREYVYIPLGGNRKGKGRQIFNLAVVWILTGFWHGASWNYLLWGVYFLILLVAEKAFLLRVLERIPRVFRHLYALLFIGLGWVLFAFEDLSAGLSVLGGLFGVGVSGFALPSGWHEAARYLIPLAVCGFGATPVPRRLWTKWTGRSSAGGVLSALGAMGVLLLCTAYMVSASFSPFLYFRF